MARPTRQHLLNEANVKLNEARRQVAERDALIHTLRVNVAELERRNATLARDVQHHSKMSDVYRAAYHAQLDLAAAIASGKR